MKVILLQDVPSIGRKNEVKMVADGHALNFLIPRKYALPATPAALRQIETAQAASVVAREVQHSLLQKSLAELSGRIVEIEEKANEEGHLYAGIHKKELARLLNTKTHIAIPEEALELDQPIKAVGEFPITVSIGGEKTSFIVKVSAK